MADLNVNDTTDRFDLLQEKLAQLDALLKMSFGSGGEAFRGMSHALQDNYLWACSTLAGECVGLVCGFSPPNFDHGASFAEQQGAGHA